MIDPKLVKELFDYREGKLYWKKRPREMFPNKRLWKTWNSHRADKEAGATDSKGYLQIRITIKGDSMLYLAHRLIWAWHYGRWPDDQLDHIDHDPQNNRVENLREASYLVNNKNASMRSDNRSGVTGVCWYKQTSKWLATISANGKSFKLGYFKHKSEAVAARKAAEKVLGFHPNHGKAARGSKNV